MDPPTEPQVTIDSELIALEKRVLDLRRARNSVASISRLPPEILTLIFCLTVAFDTPEPFALCYSATQTRTNPTYHYVKLCHVCHAWRTVALSSPQLWARLRVHSRTKASLMDLMRKGSRSLPVFLSIWDTRKRRRIQYNNFSGTFQDMSKLQGISLYLQRNYVDYLLREVTGRAQNLQSLFIIASPLPYYSVGNHELFAGGTPNLRRIHLENYTLPWTNPIFQSTHLTHLTIHHSPPPTAQSMAELVAILRRLPELQAVLVAIPGTSETLGPMTSDDTFPVMMSKMKRFSVNTYHMETLSTILSAIRLPMDVQDIRLFFSRDSTSNSPQQEFYGACGRAFDGIFKPIEVNLLTTVNHRHRIEAVIAGSGRLLRAAEAQWLRLGSDDTRAHPFSNPALTPLLWSFANLHTLKVPNTVPEAVWTAFANAPVLAYVEVAAKQEFFLKALETPPQDGATPGAGSAVEQSSIGQNEPRQLPFPALRELDFVKVQNHLRGPPYEVPPGCLNATVYLVRALVQAVVDALKARRGDKLVLMCFRDVGEFIHSGEMGIEGPLSTIAHSAKWGDRQLDLEHCNAGMGQGGGSMAREMTSPPRPD
ncbi:hypothetical protein FA13DRAFT_1451159 [Coprinellus micaceus]|uniref:Uncharacterized protein n=1 Tax=Coprinellus micaceus TaxID=71717 RepID=A0A4Y7TMR0_COPMI|nr:hypothetical protein FA13DRAFT_1451159 [Coprinellus micaceus]